ncbi:hypothetical protein SMSP2_02520 [Limihaloglobus sulfuriphilus]|uniref:VWFA domain-containing protein n=1 Tax=Limihaloglobus sulfuriphilus TaxID=1851148 RepID=A0A1Q2MHL1_9BACT|nr:VWA domain-containing protein [Limihaloglobus sulfuriphilus]AQQ72139.1 hypothetical protein SMSP2_02520 [Limihaloglobus sulfuriphilus]
MKRIIIYLTLIAALCVGNISARETAPTETSQDISKQKPRIQMAILLDTSGSMSGLINQARTEVWTIVNEFITAQKDGVSPEFELALYEYGKSSLAADEGYLRMIVPLTNDLDLVSQELFALATNGGQEYCGWVIQDAANQLQWSQNPEDLKVIFVAGNEPFTQGPVSHKDACRLSISKGIIVNTIHCGSESDGVSGKWKDGAVLADGRFLNIDHNSRIAHIPAPQDEEIARLGAELNTTYLAYGADGSAMLERQSAQDSLNSSAPAAKVQRAVSKSSLYYDNARWDLVDAVEAEKVQLENIDKDKLPEEMKNMNIEERKQYVKENAEKRKELQHKIKLLNQMRKDYIAQQQKENAAANTLGSAIIEAVTSQAREKNFTFQSAPAADENQQPHSAEETNNPISPKAD